MLQASAALLSQTDLERMFFESVQHSKFGDLQHEVRFYRESPAHAQTQAALRQRIDRMLYDKEVQESRRASEKALHEQLTLQAPSKKGAPGKTSEPKPEPKKNAKKPAKDAESASQGSDPRLKEALSHSSRQLQAMASQVKAFSASFREETWQSRKRKRQ